MVEMMHKNFLAMLLCALLLFTAPACGEEAPLAAGRARREARERGKQNFLAH